MSTDSEDKLLEIGVVGRAHGIAGFVNIFLHNPDSSILSELETVLLQDGTGTRSVQVLEVRSGQKKCVVRLGGIDSRNDAEDIKGAKLLVPRSQLPRLEDDEFYVADLIGAEAFDGDRLLGFVTAARPQGSVELVTVTSETEIMEVPLVEDFVVSVNCDEGKLQLTDTHLLPVSLRPKRTNSKKS